MRYLTATYFYILCLSFSSIDTFAQIVSSVSFDKDTVYVGDEIDVSIRISLPNDITPDGIDLHNFSEIKNIYYQEDSLNFDAYADLDILDFGTWQTNADGIVQNIKDIKSDAAGRNTISNTIKVAIYNIGAFAIGGPKIIGSKNPDTTNVATKLLYVVAPNTNIEKDTTALHPIKDIIKEEKNLSDYLTYLYIFIAILLLGFVAFLIKRRKKAIEEEILEVEMPVAAHEKALQALSLLEADQLWQKGKIKQYQSTLTEIMRTYLEDRYAITALEMTTDEISKSLQNSDFPNHRIDVLIDILQIADMVKFAKATPESDIHSQFMDRAIMIVQETKKEENMDANTQENQP